MICVCFLESSRSGPGLGLLFDQFTLHHTSGSQTVRQISVAGLWRNRLPAASCSLVLWLGPPLLFAGVGMQMLSGCVASVLQCLRLLGAPFRLLRWSNWPSMCPVCQLWMVKKTHSLAANLSGLQTFSPLPTMINQPLCLLPQGLVFNFLMKPRALFAKLPEPRKQDFIFILSSNLWGPAGTHGQDQQGKHKCRVKWGM